MASSSTAVVTIGGTFSMPSFCSGESARGLHVLLRVAAVILRLVGGEFALAVPLLRQHGEMADRVHLRALRAGLAAHRLLAVEGVHACPECRRSAGTCRRAACRTATAAWCWSADATARRISPWDWRDTARSASRWRCRACWPCRARRPRARVKPTDADCACASGENAISAHEASSARANAVRVMRFLPGGAAFCNADSSPGRRLARCGGPFPRVHGEMRRLDVQPDYSALMSLFADLQHPKSASASPSKTPQAISRRRYQT